MPLPVIVISVVSAWLASGGISVLLVRFSGPVSAVQALAEALFDADPEVTLGILAWCVALLLQLLVVSAWRRVFANMGGIIASALVGAVFSFASMALSSGMAVFQLETMTLQTRAADEARAPVLASADAARAAALELVRTTAALSLAAARKAEIEISQGGTCAESSIAGEGPIQRRSILHAGQAQEIGVMVQYWAYAVEDAADALSIAEPRQSAVNLRVDTLRGLFRDQALLDARSMLSAMAIDMDPTAGWTDNGRTYTCTDPDYAAAIAATVTVVEDLVGTSISTPRLTELTPAAGFESVWEAVGARIEGRETDAVGETGLVIAFVVELIQIVLIHIAAAVKTRRGQSPHRLDAFADGKSPNRPSHRKEKEAAIADTLRDRTIRYKGKTWFVSAVPPSSEEDAVIKRLDLPHPPSLFSAIPKGVMMWLPEFDAMRGYMTASAFDLRKIPSDVTVWLRRVERDRP
ncbi:MAG: hypothetical protein ABJI96_09050 [Paracoccaceae bacterium]|uniref:hypothetical protein n=1 Tax=Roseibium sp. TaxID=1936156 RepID=UPI003297300C